MEQIQHFFLHPFFIFSTSAASTQMYNFQPEMRALHVFSGTLNVGVPISTPINQSTYRFIAEYLTSASLRFIAE
jgi:hypothetical protein